MCGVSHRIAFLRKSARFEMPGEMNGNDRQYLFKGDCQMSWVYSMTWLGAS